MSPSGFTIRIDDHMYLETIEPTNGTLSSFSFIIENFALMSPSFVTYLDTSFFTIR